MEYQAPYTENPDGTRTWHIDPDRLEGAAMLDGEDAPELTEEQFDRLTDEMRKVREEEGARDTDEGSA